MSVIRFVLSALFLAAGLVTCIIGVIGVFKFRYAANRMHAAAINDTLGISLCMIGLAISAPDIWAALKFALVILFFWITAPVASHLLCRLEIETNEDREKYMEVHPLEGQPEPAVDDPFYVEPVMASENPAALQADALIPEDADEVSLSDASEDVADWAPDAAKPADSNGFAEWETETDRLETEAGEEEEGK